MPFGLSQFILILAAAQGLFLAILISHKYSRLFANRFLAAFMFVFSIIVFNLFLGDLGAYSRYPVLLIIQLCLPFLAVPLFFLYAKHLTQSSLKFQKIDWLHFLTFLLSVTFWGIYFVRFGAESIASQQQLSTAGLPLVNILFDWAIAIQGLIYLIWTLFYLKRYARRIKGVFSATEKIQLDWLRNISYMLLFIFVAFLMENALFAFGVNLSNYFNFSSVLAAAAIYVMGYLGLFKSEIFIDPEIAASIRQIPSLSTQDHFDRQKLAAKTAQKYEKSGLTPERAKAYLEKLLQIMQDEMPYTNSELTLNQLADMLSISPHNLSEVINTQREQNYFDFINQYRVEKVKRDLADPKKQHLTILAIAFDAGFNSKTSFNTIFKKYTNLTPSEYRNRLRP